MPRLFLQSATGSIAERLRVWLRLVLQCRHKCFSMGRATNSVCPLAFCTMRSTLTHSNDSQNSEPSVVQAKPTPTHCKLKVAHQIASSTDGSRPYRSTGMDPQFVLDGILSPGWYMLEVMLDSESVNPQARVYLDSGNGFSQECSMGLHLKTRKLGKRLIWIDASSRLRFDPLESAEAFSVLHFRVIRVCRRFAESRMLRKLCAVHPSFRGKSGTVVRSIIREQQTPDERWIDTAWHHYSNVFERSHRIDYRDWVRTVEPQLVPNRSRQQVIARSWRKQPLISILVPVHNTPESLLRQCVESILVQTYENWELCIVDDASDASHIRRVLQEYERSDDRLHVVFRSHNGHICASSNDALDLATGSFIALLDHDDTLAPHALWSVVEALQNYPNAQVIYSDEDKIDTLGERSDPYFKPAFSRELLYGQNFVSHFGVFRTQLVRDLGGFRKGLEGSQDYDLVLRCAAQIDDEQIVHIPRVLYHWRICESSTASDPMRKPYAIGAAHRALESHFAAINPAVRISVTSPGLYRAHWPLPDPQPLVSLIIPTRDGYEIIKPCIDSILNKTSYANYEILIVDNQSTCRRTISYLHSVSELQNVRVLNFEAPFNYSAINNFAASKTCGKIIGLVNNDVEVIGADWLGEMIRYAIRPEVGCVGAKLYYTDGTIQHAGVILGLGGVANHSHRHAPRDANGYFGRLKIAHEVSAVTGAALVVRRNVFEEVGGLDEIGLPVAFNDVDLCLKVRAAGYRNIWTPQAELFHHESATRGRDQTPTAAARLLGETQVMHRRWGSALQSDPFYHPLLSDTHGDFCPVGALAKKAEARTRAFVISPGEAHVA